MVILSLQVAVGWLQYFDVFRSLNNNFSVSGAFGNPGPYAIYLSVLLPVPISLLLNRKNAWYCKAFALLIGIQTIALIIILQSRSAWIALSIALVYAFIQKVEFIKKRYIQHLGRIQRIVILAAILGALTVSGQLLFNLKKDSAIGRTFIWQRTLEMIWDKPILGCGYDNFEPEYNEVKARFFSDPIHVEMYQNYASPVSYAFNYFLHLWAEQGLISLLLFLVFILLILRMRSEDEKGRLLKSMLLVILIASLFSYPLQVLSLRILFFIIAGMIVGTCEDKQLFVLTHVRLIKSILINVMLMGVLLVSYSLIQNKAYRQWKEAYVLLKQGKVNDGFLVYENVSKTLSSDKYFIYNYGSELTLHGDYSNGIPLIEQCILLINDEEVYTQLGAAYETTQGISQAISAFEKAQRLAPYKMMSSYRLISLYFSTGRKDEAISLAQKLMENKVKIPSDKTRMMQNDIQDFLEWIPDQQ